ncbi:glycoside hydrolase family 27 protein [Dyella sp. A6]|uniref:glycoside hydrolase family 27 protein n=1 Tax=Dyella aluminiiresistens TaxID=3069105 RepID=UPI002E76D5F6|nr:glycoside hydrolase family 27 protein [Dyella sp. A6]
MGWNSWNSFGATITEAQTRETAAIMARELLPAGYDVLTVDIQWYEPDATGYAYAAHPIPTLDRYGRLLPAPNRFPSSAGGHGFAPLARHVHALGLRFGVHLMRGIPRLAVERDCPVLGTKFTAREIADTSSTCAWNPDMYGVDMSRPGAQAYYDSVFALLASWGVDFVKLDDLSRPYDAHAPEIEAIASAIERSGRPMVLSMSPGPTPLVRATHARKHAQMWRISDDFWDHWPMLKAQFTRLENWSPYCGDGGWPDADMLPLGRLKLGTRNTRFTPDEQRTLMSLWSIARSPLIMGGDLRHLDIPTLALLTNPEVIAVNQASSDNRPYFVADGTSVWAARSPGGEVYVGLFNTSDQTRDVAIELALLNITGSVAVRDLWQRRPDGTAKGSLSRTLPPHGAGLYRLERA